MGNDDDRTVRCFYHSADLDGKCSAAIVLRAHPDAVLYPINYGDPFPWALFQKDKPRDLVYMVDFALQPWSGMERLAKLCDLVWIDHHETAIANWTCNRKTAVDGANSSTGQGACLLVWRHLFPDEPVPDAVELISKWDVWDHDDPQVVHFQYGMQGVDNDPGARIWVDLLNVGDPISEARVFVTEQRGKTIWQYEQRQNAQRIKALRFDTELSGLRCLAANVGLVSSKLFDAVWDPKAYDCMLTFHHRKGCWNVSLYSDKPSVHCGEVAKQYGGGGHKGAAGFQCDALPFDLPTRGKHADR
jgi:oligoribonuclease NrnB/cAMP/cGMP phosphodiesterase (DHH superfamily)